MLALETKILSLGMICPGDHHQRNPNAPKFEDQSQEKDRMARAMCPRSRRGSWPKHILKLKEKDQRKDNML